MCYFSGRMPDSQSREPAFESPLRLFRSLAIFVFSPHFPSSISWINEYMATDSGGNCYTTISTFCIVSEPIERFLDSVEGRFMLARVLDGNGLLTCHRMLSKLAAEAICGIHFI